MPRLVEEKEQGLAAERTLASKISSDKAKHLVGNKGLAAKNGLSAPEVKEEKECVTIAVNLGTSLQIARNHQE